MRKLHVSGEYYYDNDEWISWRGDVELDDEQVANFIKLIMYNGGDTNVENIALKETYPDINDILDKACYKATLDAYNQYLRSCGKPEVDKLDFQHEVNVPHEFQDLFWLKNNYYYEYEWISLWRILF